MSSKHVSFTTLTTIRDGVKISPLAQQQKTRGGKNNKKANDGDQLQ